METQLLDGPKVELTHDIQRQPSARPLENAVFRIVQEGLTNARRHSKSDRIHVKLHQNDRTIRVELRDWGVGFDVSKVPSGHFGLEGIRQRAKLFGGRATIESSPGQGTCVVVELPEVLAAETEDFR